MKTIEDMPQPLEGGSLDMLSIHKLNDIALDYEKKPTKAASARLRKQLNEFRKQIPFVRKALIAFDAIGYKK